MASAKFAGQTEDNMRAQVLRAYDEKLSIDQWVSEEKVPDPRLTKSTDVIVRIGGAGVCRTDLHIIEGVWKPHMDPTGDKLLPIIWDTKMQAGSKRLARKLTA